MLLLPCLHQQLPTDELQRNIDRLTSELHSTRLEQQQLAEELLALHEHADLETAQVGLICICTSLQAVPVLIIGLTDMILQLSARQRKESFRPHVQASMSTVLVTSSWHLLAQHLSCCAAGS